ncbi:unnamed protein product [Mesocestoides corti]|uniref:DUF7041 domain-containing protein n=1 Tax=Mesocestoides corti TaxID=53468 RepID=A0A0R3UBZ9_MESCO|nr:unnamed protein product [Mesocestoides corti]
MDHQESKPSITLEGISLNQPPFWPNSAPCWFAISETQFLGANIASQHAKYFHIVSALSSELANEVSDVLLHPNNDIPYDQLKAAILKRTQLTTSERINQLLSRDDLGDLKPNQILRKMRPLSNDEPLQ